ncbi:hypothetical protein [Saccharothrix syringae]|uniref:Uncharacterized protein n=1 Tax=Saccharothrix syringae TaxID=103733 RepID=A0A5Q0H1J8_SACSY|nr:hypothetical protein [Saccharothrix syringae]QFZ19785.1 hypothetical protein EKG83_22220 [Saccharothrix syringae]
MSAEARLHVRTAVWGRGDNRIAVLLLDGRTPLPVPLPTALAAKGLTLVSDLDRIALPTTRGWAVEESADGALTLRWPHRTPLLDRAAVARPGVWSWAAGRRRAVLLLVGADLELGAPDHHALLARAAAGGTLAGGAVPYSRITPQRESAGRTLVTHSPSR